MPEKTKEIQYVCCHCGKSLNLRTNFIKPKSHIYVGINRLPICKVCLSELFDEYTERYKDSRIAMKRICMAFDLYYNDDLYDTCADDYDTLLNNYIKRLNMNQYQGKTFDTTLQEGFTFIKEAKEPKKKVEETVVFKEEPKINPDDIDRWGDGLSYDDYENLNRHYKYLKRANPNCDSNQEIFIEDLCYIKMQQMKAIRENRPDDYGKMADQYRKSFEKAGLKTTRDVSETEAFTVGVSIETIEKYTPAEYYKNKSLHKDFDNIGDYIERFCLRPLRNLMYGTTDRDYEFYVKDEDEEDVNEFTDE